MDLKKLPLYLLFTALAFAPIKAKAQTIYGQIEDMLAPGEGIPVELILRNLRTQETIEIDTDNDGNFRHEPNRVINPKYDNFNPSEILEAKVFDLNGRKKYPPEEK